MAPGRKIGTNIHQRCQNSDTHGLRGTSRPVSSLVMFPEARPPVSGRYRRISTLSSTPESSVFLVEDANRGQRRAVLKVLRIAGPRALEVAQREFEVLRRLQHRNIAEVFDFGRLGAQDVGNLLNSGTDLKGFEFAYIASAYYEGLDLREAFLRLFSEDRFGESPPEESTASRWRIFLEALAQICEGLCAIHARGLIHYDIKPENLVLIPQGRGARALEPDSQEPIERFEAKILDFGLSEKETTPLGTRARGTVPFMAPELLGAKHCDQRADLFSLGVAIAFAVTGRSPFQGKRAERWLAAALAGRIIDLRKTCPDMPRELVDLTEALLRPRPSERPQTALEVLSLLEKMGGFKLPGIKPVRRRTIPSIGWERELSQIRREIENLKRGEAEKTLMVLEGDSGQFLDELLDEVEILGGIEGVLTRSGTAFLPRRYPFQPFSEIAHKLSHDFDLSSPRFKGYAATLAAFAPLGLSAETLGRSDLPALRPKAEAYRFMDSMTGFFLEASRETPLVLIIRGLEQAGKDAIDLLRSLARNAHLRQPRRDGALEPEPARLLLVATYREGASDRDNFVESHGIEGSLTELHGEPFTAHIRLNNLGLDRISEWIRERAPELRLEGELIRRLHEKTGGSPWLIEEFILRALGEGVAATSMSKHGLEAADPQILLRLPRNPGEATYERAQCLPASHCRVLEILAAAHGPLLLQDIAAVESVAPEEVESLSARIEDLHDLGFVTIRETASGLESGLSHNELAGQVYRQAPEEQRVAVHRALALALLKKAETDGPARCPEDLAFHARMAGLDGLYFKQALLAADKLCSAHACEAAAHLYEEILEQLGTRSKLSPEAPLLELAPDLLRARVISQLSAIYVARGQFQKAVEKLSFLAATQEKPLDPERLAVIYRTLGEVYQQTGEQANAAYFMEKSLRLLTPNPERAITEEAKSGVLSSNALKEHLLTLLSMARYHLSRDSLNDTLKVLRTIFTLAAPPEAHRETNARAHLLECEVAARRGNHAQALAASLRGLDLAEAEKSLPLVLEALPCIGRSHEALGDYDRALEHLERGLEISRQIESKIDAAASLSNIGTLHHNRADHERALDCFTRSLWLFSQVGDLKGIANSHNNLGIVYRLKDDLDRASDCYRRAIDIFSRLNDQQGIATSMNNLSSCLEHEGKYNEALDYSFRALDKRKKSRSSSGMAFSYYRIGKIYQAKGELEKAATYAEKSLQIRVEIGERLGMAYTRLLLAEVDVSRGRYAESLQLGEAAMKDFHGIENEVGTLLTREVLARVHLRVGDLKGARAMLEDVLVESGKRQQTILTGHCLLSLSRIHAQVGDYPKSRSLLSRAEKLYRSLQNQREVAEALLESCALYLHVEAWDSAAEALEEAYSILEELGVRDLVPRYFLERGRLSEATGSSTDVESTRKFFERGLVESREFGLLDLQWQLHIEKGKMDARLGDPKLARIHFLEAKKVLDAIHASLPRELQEVFFVQPERRQPEQLLLDGSVEKSMQASRDKISGNDSLQATAWNPTQGARRSNIEEALHLNRETLKLHRIAAAIGTEPDLHKLLETVLDAVIDLADAERGFVVLRNSSGTNRQEGQSISVARNLDQEAILDPQGKISNSILREVLKTGKPVILGNALLEPRLKNARSVRELKLMSLVCVPLRFRSEVLGLIYLDHRHLKDAFRSDDLSLLQAFADQAAVAVVNARLMEENVRRTNELIEANRKMEMANAQLESTVKERNEQLAVAKEDLRNRQDQLEARYRFHNLVGKSEAMREIFSLLEKVEPTQLPVLLEGESGTGKELIARALHFNGTRRQARFVSLNCGALNESLLESELFGHTRGSFTGAISDKKGLFEIADNGTIFLDEVSDMGLAMQQKLLRVLQEGEIRRVGGKENIRINVRIISASNKSLIDLVAREVFRQDLYYRIHGVKIHMPSLRDRKEDIPLLVEHFLEFAQKPGEPRRKFSPGAIRALMARDWPGNVRELRHFVERTLIITPAKVVEEGDLVFDEFSLRRENHGPPGGEALSRIPNRNQAGKAVPENGTPRSGSSLRMARDDFEREFLAQRLRETGGNVAAAARSSKVSRESLYRLLRKYGLTPRGPHS